MKNIIITGASSGIGRELALELAKENQVIGSYFHSEQEAKELQKIETIEMRKVDLRNSEEIETFVKQVAEEYQKIDVLINNAGISQIKLFTEITNEDWQEMLATNLSSVFYLTRDVAKWMVAEKNGCIINLSSIWGQTGGSCEVHYSIVKAGIDGLTKALAKELGPSNIRVNSIAPGLIDTEMISDFSKEEIKEIEAQIPLGKIGKPIDIAKTANWLIEDEYTTGQVISPNGGWVIT